MTKPVDLVDRGFDAYFGSQRMADLCGLFGREDLLQEYVYRIHEEDNSLDMKRGEFYPEILRAIVTLKHVAATAYGIEPLSVHPNFGSNGSIDTIATAMKLREVQRRIDPVREGGMLVATPTYFRNYNSCASKQMRMIKLPLNEPGWSFDLNGMLRAVEEQRPTVIFIVTPNNPTGLAVPDDDLLKLLTEVPGDMPVVIDRTLVNIKPEVTTETLLRRFSEKQLVILHSFSKYDGMSHLRVGLALYSNAAFADEVSPLLPLGLGLEAAVKAARILAELGPLRPSEATLANVRASKAVLADFCKEVEIFSCSDAVGNYALLHLPKGYDSLAVEQDLMKAGIFVMGGHGFPEPRSDLLRLHIGGKPEFMERTVRALRGLVR